MNLDPEQARRHFAANRVAYLATVGDAGQPHIVPVTYAVDGDTVYIAIDSKPKRSTDLKRLRNIAANPRVTLLADRYDDDWSKLWWVRGDGTAQILTEAAERQAPLELLQQRYPQYVEDVPEGPVIAVSVSAWSGWAFSESNRLPG